MATKRKIYLKELTDNECRKLLKEEMHRMDFLKPLYNQIYRYAAYYISKMMGARINNHTFLVSFENQYFQTLQLTINIAEIWGQDTFTNGGTYKNGDALVDGKIPLPSITINMTPSVEGEIDANELMSAVEHEVTHLYDDWIWQKSGHEPLLKREKFGFNKHYIDSVFDGDNEYVEDIDRGIAYCLYASDYSEQNAFLNQTVSDLRKLGANRQNIHEKLKETSSYQLLTNCYNELKNALSSTSNAYVEEVCRMNVERFGNLSLPKKKQNIPYKETLLKWGENILKNFKKRYYSIVQYYIDNLENGGQPTNTKKNY